MNSIKSKTKLKLVNEDEIESHKTFGERLSYIMKSFGITPTYIQNNYQIPEATVRSWMNSNKTIKINNIDKLMSIFKDKSIHIDVNWLTSGGENKFSIVTKNDLFEIPSDKFLMIEEAQNYRSLYEDSITHRILSNIAHFKENDLVGGRLLNENLWKNALGKYCICETILESGLFLSIVYNDDDILYFVDLYSNILHNYKKIKSCYPIVWHRNPDVERS